MPEPLNVVPHSGANAGTTVASIDDHGNITANGALYLANQGSAPAPDSTRSVVYADSGGNLTVLGPNGEATGQNVTGNLTVGGTVTVSTSASAGDVLVVTNTFPAPSNHTVRVNTVNATDRCLGIGATGDVQDRWNTTSAGFMQWGTGAGGLDTNLYRSAASTLKTDDNLVVTLTERVGTNLTVGNITALGDNGVGELQLADVTTAPTTNPTAGTVLYSQSTSATPLHVRDTAGNVRSVVDSFYQLTTNPTFTSASPTNTTIALTVEAPATYLMESAFVFQNTTGNTTISWNGPIGGTMQWCDTTTSTDYSSTINATNNAWPANASVRMSFFKGILFTTTNTGSLTATVSVSAGTTTLMSGSYLRLTRVV